MTESDFALPLALSPALQRSNIRIDLPEPPSRGFLYVQYLLVLLMQRQFKFRCLVCLLQLYSSINSVLFEVDEFHETATYLLDFTGAEALMCLHLESQISRRHQQSTIENLHSQAFNL